MTDILIQLLAAFLGTIGFAILYSTPKKQYLICGLISTVGFGVYLLLTHLGLSAAIATFTSTAVIMLMSRLMSIIRKCPITVFSTCGIFALIPGGGIYWSAYYFVTGKTGEALSHGFSAIKIVFAMVLGMVIFGDVAKLFIRTKPRPQPQ